MDPARSISALAESFAAPGLMGGTLVVLVVLAGGLLLYRTFREPYLAAMLVGWMAHLGYRFAGSLLPGDQAARLVSHLTYGVAVTAFVTAVLLYTSHSRRVPPAVAAGAGLLLTGVLRSLVWPDAAFLGMVLVAAYAVLTLSAAATLLFWSGGHRGVGPWALAVGLALLHFDENPAYVGFDSLDVLTDFTLALGMVVIVLDNLRRRTRRLEIFRKLNDVISVSPDALPILTLTLHELKGLMGCQAAWIRLCDGDHLVLAAHLDMPPAYLEERASIPLAGSLSEPVIREGKPAVVQPADARPAERQRLQEYGFQHVLLVPLRGKSAVLGTLSLAGRRHAYTRGEMEFLETVARQLGIAIENLRLLGDLMRSQRQWVSTFDAIQDLILVHDADFRIVRTNNALLRRLGKRHSEVLQQTCDAVLPNPHAWKGCPYCGSARGRAAAEAPDVCFGGFSMVSTSSYIEDGKGLHTIHMIRDTTGQREALEKYKLLFEQVQEGIFVSTPDGRLLDCNDAFVRLLGYASREELLSRDAGSLYADPGQRQAFRRIIARDNFVRNYEVTLRRKDGAHITALETAFATGDAEGNIAQYQGFLLDVTEQKRAQDEIRRRNRELYALNTIAGIATQSLDLDEILGVSLGEVVDLFSADTGGVYLIDAEKRILRRQTGRGYRTAAAEKLLELQLDGPLWKLAEEGSLNLVTQRQLALLPPPAQEFIRAEELRSWLWAIMRSKQRPVGLLAISSRQARDFTASDENLLLAIAQQLATTVENVRLYEQTRSAYQELSVAQEQLLQSEKMAAVGQLISGVAHELNNPLTAILGYAQLLEGEKLDDRAREFLHKLYRQAQRTHRVVQNLLSFSRQRKPERKEVDLAHVVQETLALRDYDFALNGIKVECDFQPGLPPVVADAHQLEQVFLNIINNAADAILEAAPGGTLYVRVFAEGEHISVEFRDTGPGISEPQRIFDPFYTTKSVGKGTGLGLSICYGIVKEHGGEIAARNHPQGGAVFRVALPAGTVEVKVPSPPGRTESIALEGRVLVVDDEEEVREFVRQALCNAGAAVIAVSNAQAAMDSLEQEVFDAVILDGKMPGSFTTIDLVQWIASNRPQLLANLLVTMSSLDDPAMRNVVQGRNLASLSKPFQMAELLRAAQFVLSRARAAASQ